jgi:hypothetical protein
MRFGPEAGGLRLFQKELKMADREYTGNSVFIPSHPDRPTATGMGGGSTARPDGPVSCELSALENAISYQGGVISNLATLVAPILAGTADPPSERADKPIGSAVTLRILDARQSIVENTQVLENILQRIEL